jgi:adenosyl cobinamide kinase/adenosyl cobinamide phosphate guanylyltransferase
MITLITGGARSGKSTLAERVAAARAAPVTYFATAEVYDPDMEQRVQIHRERRPVEWSTVEVGPELPEALRACEGLAIVECLGTWLSRFEDFEVDSTDLVYALRSRSGDTIVVTNEVGMGVHPYTEVGRRFRDALGRLNTEVADQADEVLLVVSGRVLRLDRS